MLNLMVKFNEQELMVVQSYEPVLVEHEIFQEHVFI